MKNFNSDIIVSVIIRCFNEEKHIGNLLSSLKNQTLKNYEVIIVDSGSTDQTVYIAKQFSPTIVHISPDEFTFGYSLNKGCSAAKGDFFVIASAHVLPYHETWLEEMIKPFHDAKVGVTYGKQIGNHTTKFSEHQVFAQQFPDKSNYQQTTPFCNNANAAIRRTIWEQHHYDETLSGLEDVEMGKWVIENDYRLAYNANAAIIHIHEETPGKILNRYKREAIALKQIFPDSHLRITEFVSLWMSNMALDILRAAKQRKLFSCLTDIVMFRTMQYLGTYQGIHNRSPLTHEMIMRFYYPRKPQRFTKSSSS
jgi:glycosyltransferase involved in cell wall biosynthesis